MRFDKEAQIWDEKPRRVELAKNVSEYVNKYISENSEVLDFGCGTGLVSLNFCGKAKTIVGVDLSQEMVNIYNKKVNILNCQAEAICKDVNNVNKKFDIIVSSMVFHHIENVQEIMNVLSTKLKDNGKLFIADLYEEDGTFHDNGNDDVFHYGFIKENFSNPNFKIENFQKIYTIKKHKEFDVFLIELTKVSRETLKK